MRSPTVMHLFAGAGGGGLGFRRAGFRGLGAIDSSPAACRDFEALVGEPALCADIATMSPADLSALSEDSPDVVFTSPPCKGFSGCLPEGRADTPHYKALNSLAFRGIWLALEAWEQKPRLILLENVPRIQSRGREWLKQIVALLHSYGYAVAETTHDCGVLGGLAQRRRRFLLVARHMGQVASFLRVPADKRVRAIGEVLGALPVPLPGSVAGGPMHRLPRLSAMNWIRLALIPAGKDWRAIPESVRLPTRAGRPNGPFGVEHWLGAAHAVLGHTTSRDTWGSVADPRLAHSEHRGCRGVQSWDFASKTIRGAHNVNNAPASVADPRVQCVRRDGGHGVRPWDGRSAAIIGHPSIDNFPAQVADPRMGCSARCGTMGVEGWAEPLHTVRGHHDIGDSPAAVADPRPFELLGPPIDISTRRPIHLTIRALDGTWHRPMTTLELAALQGFPTAVDGGHLQLDGKSHAGWRERIGNAVPPPTAEAIGLSCSATLAAAAAGRWELDGNPIWVREQQRRGLALAQHDTTTTARLAPTTPTIPRR